MNDFFQNNENLCPRRNQYRYKGTALQLARHEGTIHGFNGKQNNPCQIYLLDFSGFERSNDVRTGKMRGARKGSVTQPEA